MKRLLPLLILVLFASCRGRNEADPEFLTSEAWCLTVKGSTVMSYNPLQHQCSYNASTRTFRLCDDEATKWFVLRLDALPTSEGTKITGDISWSGGGTKTGFKFTVSQILGDSFWLWSPKEKIGVSATILK